MQVFKGFFSVLRRNMGLMIMYGAIMIILSATLSNVQTQPAATNFEDSRIPVTVIDRDGSEISKGLETYLYGRQREVPLADDREALQDALYLRNTEYILFLPEGFGASVEAGEPLELTSTQVPESYAATYVGEQVGGYLATLRTYLAAGFAPADALEKAGQDADTRVEASLNGREVESVPGVYYYFHYLCYGLAMVMIFGLSPVLLVFGKKDLAARMSASALLLRRKNTQIALGAFVLAAICFVAFMVVGLVLYRGGMTEAGALLCMLNGVAFLFFSVALALLVGQVARSGNMISAIANVVVLAMCFLGGVFVPYELMGGAMQTLAKFMPTHWYLQGVDNVATAARLSADTLAVFWQGIGMQLIFGVALLAVAVVISKQKQKIA